MTSRALVSAAGLGAAVIVFAVGAGASSGASSRVAHDPCGSDPHPFVKGELHCGAIFEIPGHHTWWTSEANAPPACQVKGERIPGFGQPEHWSIDVHSAKWDYWTKEGKWVLWDGGYELRHHGSGPVQIRPRFHNWGSEAWPVRVHFECKRF